MCSNANHNKSKSLLGALLDLLGPLVPKRVLHLLQLLKAQANLLHHGISFLLLPLELLAEHRVLPLDFSHALLVLVGNLNDFINRDSLVGRAVGVVDAHHPHHFRL